MQLSTVASLVFSGFVTCAVAQQGNSNSLAGNWGGTMPGPGGNNQLNVELALNETGGTFVMRRFSANSGRNNPCLGKEFPIAVSSQSASEAVVKIKGSGVLSSCMDETVTFKSVDGKSMEGSLADGRLIKLDRK